MVRGSRRRRLKTDGNTRAFRQDSFVGGDEQDIELGCGGDELGVVSADLSLHCGLQDVIAVRLQFDCI